jgi:hypothetical protein
LFPGVAITAATSGSGQSGTFTLWFDHEGVPHSRSTAGTRSAPWTADASITLTGGGVISVRRRSGVIE